MKRTVIYPQGIEKNITLQYESNLITFIFMHNAFLLRK